MGSWMSNLGEKHNDMIDGCALPISEGKIYVLITGQIKFCATYFYKGKTET